MVKRIPGELTIGREIPNSIYHYQGSTVAERATIAGSKELRMTITHDQAVAKLHEWTPSQPLRNHALAVEAVMRRAAHRYGAGEVDEEQWAITGLIHDADYDQWPDEHPRRIVDWLEQQGEPEIAHAVAAHFTPWGVEPVSAG